MMAASVASATRSASHDSFPLAGSGGRPAFGSALSLDGPPREGGPKKCLGWPLQTFQNMYCTCINSTEHKQLQSEA